MSDTAVYAYAPPQRVACGPSGGEPIYKSCAACGSPGALAFVVKRGGSGFLNTAILPTADGLFQEAVYCSEECLRKHWSNP